MSKGGFVKKSIVALTLVFSSVVMPVALSDNDITGVWQNDEVGTIDIQLCEDNKERLCGYLLEVKPDISEQFNLYVYKNRERNLIITGLQFKDDSGKFKDGKFKNIDGFLARNSKVSVTYDGDNAKVRASIAFFVANFKFSRAKPQIEAPEIVSVSKKNINSRI